MEYRVETYDPEGNVEVTTLTIEVTNEMLRAKREGAFLRTDPWTTMDRFNALTEEQQNELTTYRQLLRDLTDREDKDQAYADIIEQMPAWCV